MNSSIYISTIPINIRLSCEYGKSILACKYYFNNRFCYGEPTLGRIALALVLFGIVVGQIMALLARRR